MGANGFAFLGSSQHHLENTWQGAVLWAEAISICLYLCQRGRVKWACFDDFTMSVLHLSSYSNRARHELYISLGLSVAQLVDFSSVQSTILFVGTLTSSMNDKDVRLHGDLSTD